MCSATSRRWRVSVEDGQALIEKWKPAEVYISGQWVIVATIPMDDALEIARTLMRERKRPLAHEAVAAMEAG